MKAIDSGRIRSRAAGAGLAVLAILAAAGNAAAAGLVPRSLGPTTSTVVTIEKTTRQGQSSSSAATARWISSSPKDARSVTRSALDETDFAGAVPSRSDARQSGPTGARLLR